MLHYNLKLRTLSRNRKIFSGISTSSLILQDYLIKLKILFMETTDNIKKNIPKVTCKPGLFYDPRIG